MKGEYTIRIYDQDLCIGWIDNGGYKTPSKYINWKELITDLKNNGLTIIEWSFSNIGQCYFLKVKGTYTGTIKYSVVIDFPDTSNIPLNTQIQ